MDLLTLFNLILNIIILAIFSIFFYKTIPKFSIFFQSIEITEEESKAKNEEFANQVSSIVQNSLISLLISEENQTRLSEYLSDQIGGTVVDVLMADEIKQYLQNMIAESVNSITEQFKISNPILNDIKLDDVDDEHVKDMVGQFTVNSVIDSLDPAIVENLAGLLGEDWREQAKAKPATFMKFIQGLNSIGAIDMINSFLGKFNGGSNGKTTKQISSSSQGF